MKGIVNIMKKTTRFTAMIAAMAMTMMSVGAMSASATDDGSVRQEEFQTWTAAKSICILLRSAETQDKVRMLRCHLKS